MLSMISYTSPNTRPILHQRVKQSHYFTDYNLYFFNLQGGADVESKNLHLKAVNLTVDDGGIINLNNGGYLAMRGPGTVITKNWRASGAGHGGTGGQPKCSGSGYKTCRIRKGLAYGDMFEPTEFGSGGDRNGGTGGGKVKIDVSHTCKVGRRFILKCGNGHHIKII